jgi:hypothetical protein
MFPLSACFAGPTVLAFVPSPDTVDLLVDWCQEFSTEDGALLQLTLAGAGSIWPKIGPAGKRTGLNLVTNVLKVVGLPALWGQEHYDSFFAVLYSQALFSGEYSLERPQRPDGSLMDLGKLTCGLNTTIVLLADLGSVRVAQADLSTTEVRFERISDRFDWRLPEDTAWCLIAQSTDTTTRHHRRADEGQ